MGKKQRVRIIWQAKTTGYEGFGDWHPSDLAMALIDRVKALNEEFPSLIHSVEYEVEKPTPSECNHPEEKMMDKRSIIAEFLHKFAAENYPAEMYLHAADTLLDKLDGPTPSKCNWLQLNEKTPNDAVVARLYDDNQHGYLVICDNQNKRSNEGPWRLFVGIHLLPWDGSEKPPCEGLVFITKKRPLANEYQAFTAYADGVIWEGVTGWAPVKWIDGKLVVDLDRLKDE